MKPGAPMPDGFLRFERISKAFGGVQALNSVSFGVARGEIHAVVGENGAGKSTLMKILAAVYPHGDYEGAVFIDGTQCRFARVLDAEAAGVVLIPQELAVVGQLSVAENMFLNAWPRHRGSLGGLVDWDELHERTQKTIARLGIQVPFGALMKTLSAAQQQMVLIAKALSKDVRILLLDEPTSSLSTAETATLFGRLHHLKAEGITALYISHKIDEVMEIADRVTVLRDGGWVATRPTAGLSPGELVTMMVGRTISQMYPRQERTPGPPALQVRGLTAWHPEEDESEVLSSIDLEVREGEIVGIYGLMGSGRTELLSALFGAWEGRLRFDAFTVASRAVTPASPRAMMEHGLGFLTEDRKRSGIIPGKPVQLNLTLASLDKISNGPLLDAGLERERAQRYVKNLAVKTPSLETAIDDLSGGNQQKVLIGRWLSAEARVLLLDDPTRGVDVGAKVEIFHLLNRLAAEKAAIIFVSSELPEVLGIADRLLVMHEGRMVADLPWREATQEAVMHHATGGGAPRHG
jgi:D-xylose transport system ATP-binding protein